MRDSGRPHRPRRRSLALALAFLLAASLPAQGYRAADVIDLGYFPGSPEARALLLKQGFVAIENLPARSHKAARPVRHLFEAYISQELPPFVSVDLVVDALVYLLEDVVRRIEHSQQEQLLVFSRRLHEAAKRTGAAHVAELARIGLLLQSNDEAETKRWQRAAEQGRRITVVPGTTPVAAKLLVPVGDYATPRLAGYFRARRLYQECAFRRDDEGGARSARALASLLETDAEVAKLFGALQKPWNELLGPPARGTDPCVLPAHRTPLRTITERVRIPPTGLVVLAAGPLRSDLGTAVWSRSVGDDAGALLRKIGKVETPDSSFGRFLEVLGRLSLPVDRRAPGLFRGDAWKHKQLATQLGSWARLRHPFALQAEEACLLGLSFGTPGIVSPYPRVFRGLANIAEEIAAQIPAGDLLAARRRLRVARILLDATWEQRPKKLKELSGSERDRLWQNLWEAFDLFEARVEGLSPEDSDEVMVRDLKALTETPIGELSGDLRSLLERCARGRTGPDLVRLARLCRRLAAIADKQLAGKARNASDRMLLADIGETIGVLRGYRGNAWLSPRDDHPHVVPVGVTPDATAVLNVGVARPDALYLILDTPEGPALYLGAMLSYRGTLDQQPLTDSEWIARIRAGKCPPALRFTRKFRR